MGSCKISGVSTSLQDLWNLRPFKNIDPHRLVKNLKMPKTTARVFVFSMFVQLNAAQIKGFNFHVVLMWYGFDLNFSGVFTVAVSWLRDIV